MGIDGANVLQLGDRIENQDQVGFQDRQVFGENLRRPSDNKGDLHFLAGMTVGGSHTRTPKKGGSGNSRLGLSETVGEVDI
jgi:hypothetical protein